MWLGEKLGKSVGGRTRTFFFQKRTEDPSLLQSNGSDDKTRPDKTTIVAPTDTDLVW